MSFGTNCRETISCASTDRIYILIGLMLERVKAKGELSGKRMAPFVFDYVVTAIASV